MGIVRALPDLFAYVIYGVLTGGFNNHPWWILGGVGWNFVFGVMGIVRALPDLFAYVIYGVLTGGFNNHPWWILGGVGWNFVFGVMSIVRALPGSTLPNESVPVIK